MEKDDDFEKKENKSEIPDASGDEERFQIEKNSEEELQSQEEEEVSDNIVEDSFGPNEASEAPEEAQDPQVANFDELKELKKQRIATEDIEYVDDHSRAILKESSASSHVLLWLIVFFVLSFIIWAKYAVIDERTIAIGKIIPSSSIKVIQNLEGGILEEMLVKEGAIVEESQILLRLDDTRFASSYREGYSRYLNILASIARLKAESQGLDTVVFPDTLLENNDKGVMNSELKLFNARQEQLNSSLEMLKESKRLAEQELKITEPLVNEGLMSQLDLIRLRRQLNEVTGKIDIQIDNFRSTARTELDEKETELGGLVEKILAAEDRMVRTVLRSPVRGTVKKINISTVGGIIKPGMDIMEIVPLEDTLLVEAKVNPTDIAFIHPGQKAIVKLSAYDFSIYGGLDGVVEYISADSIAEEQKKEETYYKILVRTDKNYLGSPTKPLPIIPGMPATVDILTGERSILDYILKPFKKATSQALRER